MNIIFFKIENTQKETEEIGERIKDIYAKSPSVFKKLYYLGSNLLFKRPYEFSKNLISKAKLYLIDMPFGICRKRKKKD
jgi:hypothetical protein